MIPSFKKPNPVPIEQLRPNSWQYEEAVTKGREFYGEPRDEEALRQLEARVSASNISKIPMRKSVVPVAQYHCSGVHQDSIELTA